MKTIPLELSRDKWKKNFDKAVSPDSLARRFTLSDRDEFLGKRSEDGFYFFEKRKARFAVLSPVLKGKILSSGQGTAFCYHFARPGFPGWLLLAWGVLMIATGCFFLTEDLFLFAGFFLPGLLGILPQVCYTQKRKKKLKEHLERILEQKV